MKGDFLKLSKLDDEEGADQLPQNEDLSALPADSLQIRILNAISGASDEKVSEIFSAMKTQLKLPPAMEASYAERYKKVQYVQQHITNLTREQLVNIAQSLAAF